MNNYSKPSKFGGEGKKRFEGRDSGKSTEMHSAVCADCGKTCQVPFKPNGKKPVFCKDCFAKNGGQVTPRARPFVEIKKSDEQVKLLEALNLKLDKLISLTERMIQ